MNHVPHNTQTLHVAINYAMTPDQRRRTSAENVGDTLEILADRPDLRACAFGADQAPAKFDAIASIRSFNADAGNTVDRVNVRQSALYLALQFEELGEKAAAAGLKYIGASLEEYATELKNGAFASIIEANLRSPDSRLEMLDADVDLIVVSVGAALSQGADIEGALIEVCRANDAKRGPDGQLHRNEAGKITKPDGWEAPDLSHFIQR